MKKTAKSRSPEATNVENFYDAAYSSRDPGQWPMLLQRAWGMRPDMSQASPLAADNIESVGARASQYSS